MQRRMIDACLMGIALMMAAAGCSSSDDNETPTTVRPGVKARQLTIHQVESRATLSEGDGSLSAKWTAGDALSYCNLSGLGDDRSKGNNPTQGSLTASQTATVSQFAGSVTCGRGDCLAVVYPTASFSWSGEKAQYTLTLSGQDGSLQTLATRYHYVYGVADVTEVTETTASAEMVRMKSLLTVCRFSFHDAEDNAIPVKTLTIAYGMDGEDGNTGTYPQTATVVCDEYQEEVHATGVASEDVLTVTAATATEAVYVALLPTDNRTFVFTATDGSGNTYTGKATATLNEGDYVEAALKLER